MATDALLVIDDDPDFRELIRVSAEAAGLDVFEAADCVEGVVRLGELRERIGLVLLDYWMPNMTPQCCAAKLKALLRPAARLILVTAAVDARRRADELGIEDCLTKPFDIDRLLVMVRGAP